MDEYRLEHLSDMLFEHMIVVAVFYTYKNDLDIETIEKICTYADVTKLSPRVAIADLVSHGIVSAKIQNGEIYYKITEFGKYFFSVVCETNPDAKEICEKVRGYTE